MTEHIEAASPHLMNTYARLPVAMARGQGSRIWDVNGKSYLDGLAGIAAGWAMDLGKEVLTTGMKTFGIDLVDPAELIPQLAKKSQPAKKPAIARK